MLMSSLAKTGTALSEEQLLAVGRAFNAQLKFFSARQMSGSLWAFSRLGGLPSNFSLADAEAIILPELSTYVCGGVVGVGVGWSVCGGYLVYGYLVYGYLVYGY